MWHFLCWYTKLEDTSSEHGQWEKKPDEQEVFKCMGMADSAEGRSFKSPNLTLGYFYAID